MRIALISDIHYGILSTTSELSVDGEQLVTGEVTNAKPLFRGLIDILKSQKPTFLFIAGDLTSTGSPLEFRDCYQKMLQLADTVGIAKDHIIFCMGNHDIDLRISKLVDTYKFEQYATENISYLKDKYHKLAHSWSTQVTDVLNSIMPEYKNKYNAPFTGVIDYDTCVVFVLNSGHLCVHDQKYAHGCLSSKQFEWLKENISLHKDDKRVKIVLLHHHPFTYPYPTIGLDISTLEEGSELSQLCGEAGVDLVLHGHRHHPKAKTALETGWIKPVTYICSGSLSVNASHRLGGNIPNMFHIIDFHTSQEVVLRNYCYKPSTGWSLISENCQETPVDGEMLLGQIIAEEEAINLIKKLHKNEVIKYDSLPKKLKYFTYHKLNELIVQVYENKYAICGEFPKDVTIFREGE